MMFKVFSKKEKVTAVVYGTSLTAGGAWVNQLQAWIETLFPGRLTLINSGQNSRASNTGLAHLQPLVLAHSPDIVLIEFAVNDAYRDYGPKDGDRDISLEKSRSNLNAMIDRILAANPQADIVLQTMNSAWDAPSNYRAAILRPQLAEYYQGYREVARQRGLLLIDHHVHWCELQGRQRALFESYIPDGIHPEATGCEAIILPELKARLTSI
jgi:acyl-CoA thioesterase-1